MKSLPKYVPWMGMCACSMVLGVACKSDLAPAQDTSAAAPALPAAAPSAAQADPAAARIEGRLEVHPDVAKHIQAGDTIFVIARDAQSNAMVAVIKLAAPAQFPLPFVLSSKNAMMGTIPFQGSVKLSARVDKDGNATSKNPGDVVGEVAQATAIPAHDVVLTLNKVL